MADESNGKKRLNRPADLGWLAQSSVQPKKRKEIEGVGAGSLLGLKAQVAKKQQEAADIKGGRVDINALRERSKQGSIASLLERRNAGVVQRDRQDRLDIKSPADRLSESRAALERKAEIYDRLASGGQMNNEDAERYEVDFLLKGFGAGSQAPVDTAEQGAFRGAGGLVSADMLQERQRRAWEKETEATIKNETEGYEAAEKRRELIHQLEEETREGRGKAATARQEREAAEARKREKLKAAFLRRKLEAAKGASKAGGGDGVA